MADVAPRLGGQQIPAELAGLFRARVEWPSMETRIQLSMDDGPVFLSFHPKLTAAQYGLLLVAAGISHTVDDLSAAARRLAAEWGIEVVVDFA